MTEETNQVTPEEIQKREYVNKEELYNSIVERKRLIKEAELDGKPKPAITRYQAECIIKIAHKYVNRPGFFSYSFKDEMIQDAILNGIKYFDSFDPERSTQPFSYITASVHNTFVQRILKERKQTYVRQQLIKNVDLSSILESETDNQDIVTEYVEIIKGYQQSDYSEYYEKKIKEKVVKEHRNALMDFLDEPNTTIQEIPELELDESEIEKLLQE